MAIPYNTLPKFDFINQTVVDIGSFTILLQQEVVQKLQDYMTLFDIKAGRFVDDTKALALLNDIEKEIRLIISNSPYTGKVMKWIRAYDEIEKFNMLAQKSINGINITKSMFTSVRKAQIETTVNSLLSGGVDNAFIKPITQALMRNIVLGSTVSDTKNFLQNYILGDADKKGALEKYSTQIARDLLHSYDGFVNQQIANDYDLNAFAYVGSLVVDSRPQCVRWVEDFGGELALADLADEINWAFDNGSGMRPETSVDTFAVYRGGWNCRHSAVPFRLKSK